ncbi:glucosidase family protein, partial [Dawidia soli]
AMDYSRAVDDKLVYTVGISSAERTPRFDADTKRRMYVRDTTDVWAPVAIDAGKSTQSITLSYFDFNAQFGRGKLVGIDQEQVSAVLNTIARIGVIGKKHFGGNSWHTPYGPICLHEQYIAQMGLGVNDDNYLAGYRECLDYYRDNAIKPDGRVWPRWAYSNEDAMPNGFTDKGFYEAQWGYLLDSNPDFVINVAELYDQNGDLAWVKTHQASCEKALDWIVARDSDGDGLVEMMTDSYTQKRGSDWIDIIWAAYENAFVNAKLYRALVLWAGVESQLGNAVRANVYTSFALKLQASFNKPTTAGGFWDAENNCYVHWLDKDGSVHGRNMVTPVNFMAIAYDICNDPMRAKTILDNIEVQMQKEDLFFWPISLYSYAPGEGNDWQFPFPNYENGDIFLSWGSVAAKAYASYKPEIAVKYVKRVLAQYAKDGLAFQRYGRAQQDGRGDDILSGNALSVVGLYQAIYGINPLYNRFYLDPHITPELAGTQVKYNYRGQRLTIDLAMDQYAVSNGRFTIKASTDFGFYATDNELSYFKGNDHTASLQVKAFAKDELVLDIKKYGPDEVAFTQSSRASSGKLVYQLQALKPGSYYTVRVNKKTLKRVKSTAEGVVVFACSVGIGAHEISVVPR